MRKTKERDIDELGIKMKAITMAILRGLLFSLTRSNISGEENKEKDVKEKGVKRRAGIIDERDYKGYFER